MKYKFGKHPPRHDKRTLLFKNYLAPELPPPPPQFDVLDRVFSNLQTQDVEILFPMDGNDQYGCCTFAAKAHAITAYQGLIGKRTIVSGPDVIAAYLAFTAGEDTGCNELDVLNDWRQKPFAGDQILGYAAINPRNHTNVMRAISMFGGVYLGFQVQEAAETDFDARRTWTAGPLTADGHAVFATAYRPTGGTVLTWGNTQAFDWHWWDMCVDECYAILPQEAQDPNFCPGFDVQTLQADLACVTR